MREDMSVYTEDLALLNVLPTFPVLPSAPTRDNVTEEAALDDNQTALNVTSPELNSFYFYEVEQFTVLWILLALIVLGNSAVLVTLYVNKRKSRMNFFIMQLAVADLTVGLISVLTDVIWRITVVWHAGNFACKLIRFLQAVVTYSSTYVLVALSIDRYDAITHPMNFSGSWRRARVLVVAAWSLSALFSAPIFILYEERLVQGKTQCWIELPHPWQWQLYLSLVAVSLFVLPALIISGCYAVIVLTIWRKGKTLTPTSRSYRSRGQHRLQQEEQNCRRASSRGLIPKAKIKTVKMTFVIVFVFILCWSPYFVFGLLQVYGHVPNTQNNIAIATFIQSLAPLNSAANPVIYCLFSTRMCRTLRRSPREMRQLQKTGSCIGMFPLTRLSHRRRGGDSKLLRTEGKKWDLMGLNLTLLFYAGVLPTHRVASSSWRLRLYRAYPVLMVLLYIMVFTAQCLAMYKFWGDLDAVTDTAFTMVGVFMCYIQATYTTRNSDKILQLVDTLETKLTPTMKTLASTREQSILVTNTARKTRLLTWTMFVIVHGMLISWIAMPLIHRYSEGAQEMNFDSDKPLPYFCFIIWLPFDALRSPVYEIVYSIQTMCFLMACLYYTSVNTVFMTLIIHTSTQFRILVMSLRDMDELFPVQNMEREEPQMGSESNAEEYPHDLSISIGNELDAYFIECIKHHKAIIRFAEELNAVLSPLLLFYFFCSQLIMCVVTFQVVLTWGQGNSVLKFVLGLAAAACGPLMFCWFGTDIIQESLAVQQAAYGCAWYHRLRSFNRLLAVVIMRTQKPVRLKAGMFYEVSLTTFTQMLNTVYTYFAVLKQLYDE
ncbi:uncharacterized protein LOC111874907 isoform X2 [Cryptotermes secundus]|uniref:uncharacterized protein LOC111874907 isoform X2 n=1 Tax=Cryptotermes secundus TaxID=105785 RepID=UPI000CD7CA4D|nr:uncharacterized protein LOC111874907 isoform X2 [Cryptotermes secundus]